MIFAEYRACTANILKGEEVFFSDERQVLVLQIHVVRKGQSLYSIAQLYGTSVQSIAQANELPDPSRLVVGQALVIPIVGSYHRVQPGESLSSISRIYGMSVNELAQVNNLSASAALQIGQRLYIPPRPKPTIDVLLYAEPPKNINQTFLNEVRDRVGSLTYLAMFSYQVNRDGSLKAPTIGSIPAIARAAGAINAMVITNIENFAFSADLAHAVFTDAAAQNQLFGNIIQIANQVGYKDIHFDFEIMNPGDRELYSNFLKKARNRLHAAGLMISNAIAPKTSDVKTGIYGAHDYATIGQIVDLTALMTYEWGYTYSMPQAVSPIAPVRKVVEYAVSVIPRNKILLGQNLYGYNWTAPYPPAGGPPAKAVSPQHAIAIALRENAEIQYDQQAQAPFFQYIDSQGKQHVVWFEDARSIQAKFNLIKEFKLRGIMYWKLGLDFPQNWLLLTDNFNVRKRT